MALFLSENDVKAVLTAEMALAGVAVGTSAALERRSLAPVATPIRSHLTRGRRGLILLLTRAYPSSRSGRVWSGAERSALMSYASCGEWTKPN